jgi:hypothetical protein
VLSSGGVMSRLSGWCLVLGACFEEVIWCAFAAGVLGTDPVQYSGLKICRDSMSRDCGRLVAVGLLWLLGWLSCCGAGGVHLLLVSLA